MSVAVLVAVKESSKKRNLLYRAYAQNYMGVWHVDLLVILAGRF
jgi:hypothetical protein